MKVTSEKSETPLFVPFSITMEVETAEEAISLYAFFNHVDITANFPNGDNVIRDKIGEQYCPARSPINYSPELDKITARLKRDYS